MLAPPLPHGRTAATSSALRAWTKPKTPRHARRLSAWPLQRILPLGSTQKSLRASRAWTSRAIGAQWTQVWKAGMAAWQGRLALPADSRAEGPLEAALAELVPGPRAALWAGCAPQ